MNADVAALRKTWVLVWGTWIGKNSIFTTRQISLLHIFCTSRFNLWNTCFYTSSCSAFFFFGYSGIMHCLQNLDAKKKPPAKIILVPDKSVAPKKKIMLNSWSSENVLVFRKKHLKYFSLFTQSCILKCLSIS